MAVSPHEEKMIGIQRQLRQNQHDLQDFLSDLGSWEDEMKAKEQELLKKKSHEPENLPPVRNSLDKKKLKKKKKKKIDEQNKKKKISGFDFRAWDKFDVDKALEEIDGEDKKSSSEYETDEEWEVERRKHLALEKKNTGNSHLSAGAYEVAVEHYTEGMELDPTNAILPANRAMAFIKMEKYGAAEVDCTTAITLDPLYVKAYLRRAAARVGLQHLSPALQDYQRVLQLEPANKQAAKEVDRLQKEIERENDQRPSASSLEKDQSSEVKAIYKLPEQRSKKPLRRIEIEEIGVKENTSRKSAIAKVEATQSTAKKEMEAKDRQMFEKFTTTAASDKGEKEATKDYSVKPSPSAVGSASVQSEKLQRDNKLTTTELTENVTNNKAPSISRTVVNNTDGKFENSNRLKNGKSTGDYSLQKQDKMMSAASRLNDAPPQSSFQFQSDIKLFNNDLHAFYKYFMRIDPDVYPKLFGLSLEAPILLRIIEAFRVHCIPEGEDCFRHLKGLTRVQRFSMVVMFLSPKDKKGIREVFEYLKTSGKHPEKDIAGLVKTYEV